MRGPNIDPQILGFPQNKDPNKVPPIFGNPILGCVKGLGLRASASSFGPSGCMGGREQSENSGESTPGLSTAACGLGFRV